MGRYDLILQPKTGTHVEHAMAALDGVSIPELKDSGRDVPYPDGGPCLHDPALKWCKEFGLDPDAQPEDLIEGANETENGFACIEVKQDPFVQMLYCIYGICKIGAEGEWMDMRLKGDLMRNHFVENESEDEEDVVIPPTVIAQFTQKRDLKYNIRVLSDGTFELRGTSPYALGDRFYGAWHGPFPASEFPTMFPGQEIPPSLSNPNDI